MHELEKISGDSFMWFMKVYIYYSNTSKPYNSLSQKEKLDKKLELDVPKLFVISKKKDITIEDIERSIREDPDFQGSLDKMVINRNKWKKWSKDYIVYGAHPISIYDFKLLINLFGVRLLRFI